MQSVYNHKFRRSMNNSSIINPVLPKGCVANCVGRVWFGLWLWYGRGVQILGFGKQAYCGYHSEYPQGIAIGLLSLLYIAMHDRYTFRIAVQERNFIRGRRGTCTFWRRQRVPMTRRLQPSPFKAAKNFRRNSALYFSCMLAPPCLAEAWWIVAIHAPFPYYYWALFWDQFWPQFWEQFWAPFWALQYELKERGPKLKPKLGPKSGPKSGTTFAKLFAHFFGNAANRCPRWSCPCFVTFAFFLVRAHPCTHSATANSSEARSYWKKNARKRE